MKPARNYSDRAFTLIELLIIIATFSILAVLLLPRLARPKGYGHINCRNNLKQVGIAFKVWALDNGDKYPMQVSVTNGGTRELVSSGAVFSHFQVMSNELSTPKLLFCPQENDPKRTLANTFATVAIAGQVRFNNDNQVSYFVGVDADSGQPSMFLAGDRNLAFKEIPAKPGLSEVWTNSAASWVRPRHDGGGNILLADASVQGLTTRALSAALKATGQATNRLAIP